MDLVKNSVYCLVNRSETVDWVINHITLTLILNTEDTDSWISLQVVLIYWSPLLAASNLLSINVNPNTPLP